MAQVCAAWCNRDNRGFTQVVFRVNSWWRSGGRGKPCPLVVRKPPSAKVSSHLASCVSWVRPCSGKLSLMLSASLSSLVSSTLSEECSLYLHPASASSLLSPYLLYPFLCRLCVLSGSRFCSTTWMLSAWRPSASWPLTPKYFQSTSPKPRDHLLQNHDTFIKPKKININFIILSGIQSIFKFLRQENIFYTFSFFSKTGSNLGSAF